MRLENNVHNPPFDAQAVKRLTAVLQHYPEIELAVLVGSRARREAHATSDWDIAVRWLKNTPPLVKHQSATKLTLELAATLGVAPDLIDLIDLSVARLAMRAVVAEEGLALKGTDTPAWHHFLTLTWSEMEDFEWRSKHAA
jgi:predicted nucleotidyltransferase